MTYGPAAASAFRRLQSRHITTPGTAMRLIQKELAVAGRCLRILINRDDDRLDVLIASTFSSSEIAYFLEPRFGLDH
jgi:hypothetical protein